MEISRSRRWIFSVAKSSRPRKQEFSDDCPQFARRGPYNPLITATDTVKCTLTPIHASIRDGTHAMKMRARAQRVIRRR